MLKAKVWFEPSSMHELFNGALCYDFKNDVFYIHGAKTAKTNEVCIEFKMETADGRTKRISEKDYPILRQMALVGYFSGTKKILNGLVYNENNGRLYVKNISPAFDLMLLEEWFQNIIPENSETMEDDKS